MKLLLDQNISPRIVKHLSGLFSDVQHVRNVGLENASDSSIFEFAKRNNLAIVTFDSDFVDLNVVRGIPPKIIWIKTGNLTTKSIVEILNKNSDLIKHFLDSDQKEQEILEILKYEV